MDESLKCILVSLDEDVSELSGLAESMNFQVENTFIQNRNNPSPRFFIGKGKAEEIKNYIKDNDIEMAVFDSQLKPSQQFNLENFLGITVYDRIRLILEIFRDRARSEEARLQVELAKLQYEIPLLRDWIHKARYSEKPGFMAGGEYEVAQYYEISRRRIKKIKSKLEKIEKEREIRRKQRRNLGYYLVSIVGYTNAGKSTLFNMISEESVAVENRMFSTLSTTTRKIPGLNKPVLLTDTVGLIDNLPHWMIEAFHSTLEEVFLSDLVLLCLDISESASEINRKLNTGFEVLLPDINPMNIILVLNKIDRIKGIDEEEKKVQILDELEIGHRAGGTIFISAQDRNYKEKVIQSILQDLVYPINLSLTIPNISDSQTFISWLHSDCEIISIKYDDDIKLEFRCRERDMGVIKKFCTRHKIDIDIS